MSDNGTMSQARIVALVVTAIRSGIQDNSIIAFVRSQGLLRDAVIQQDCFLRALEVNEGLTARFGTGIIPVSAIVEAVRTFFRGQQGSSLNNSVEHANLLQDSIGSEEEEDPAPGSVIQLFTKSSKTETSLNRLGERVLVIDDSADWVYVELSNPPRSGWVPKYCISIDRSSDLVI